MCKVRGCPVVGMETCQHHAHFFAFPASLMGDGLEFGDLRDGNKPGRIARLHVARLSELRSDPERLLRFEPPAPRPEPKPRSRRPAATMACSAPDCRREFLPNKSDQKYCSGRCKRRIWNRAKRARVRPSRDCPGCGSDFSGGRKYCSTPCRAEHRLRLLREKTKAARAQTARAA